MAQDYIDDNKKLLYGLLNENKYFGKSPISEADFGKRLDDDDYASEVYDLLRQNGYTSDRSVFDSRYRRSKIADDAVTTDASAVTPGAGTTATTDATQVTASTANSDQPATDNAAATPASFLTGQEGLQRDGYYIPGIGIGGHGGRNSNQPTIESEYRPPKFEDAYDKEFKRQMASFSAKTGNFDSAMYWSGWPIKPKSSAARRGEGVVRTSAGTYSDEYRKQAEEIAKKRIEGREILWEDLRQDPNFKMSREQYENTLENLDQKGMLDIIASYKNVHYNLDGLNDMLSKSASFENLKDTDTPYLAQLTGAELVRFNDEKDEKGNPKTAYVNVQDIAGNPEAFKDAEVKTNKVIKHEDGSETYEEAWFPAVKWATDWQNQPDDKKAGWLAEHSLGNTEEQFRQASENYSTINELPDNTLTHKISEVVAKASEEHDMRGVTAGAPSLTAPLAERYLAAADRKGRWSQATDEVARWFDGLSPERQKEELERSGQPDRDAFVKNVIVPLVRNEKYTAAMRNMKKYYDEGGYMLDSGLNTMLTASFAKTEEEKEVANIAKQEWEANHFWAARALDTANLALETLPMGLSGMIARGVIRGGMTFGGRMLGMSAIEAAANATRWMASHRILTSMLHGGLTMMNLENMRMGAESMIGERPTAGEFVQREARSALSGTMFGAIGGFFGKASNRLAGRFDKVWKNAVTSGSLGVGKLATEGAYFGTEDLIDQVVQYNRANDILSAPSYYSNDEVRQAREVVSRGITSDDIVSIFVHGLFKAAQMKAAGNPTGMGKAVLHGIANIKHPIESYKNAQLNLARLRKGMNLNEWQSNFELGDDELKIINRSGKYKGVYDMQSLMEKVLRVSKDDISERSRVMGISAKEAERQLVNEQLARFAVEGTQGEIRIGEGMNENTTAIPVSVAQKLMYCATGKVIHGAMAPTISYRDGKTVYLLGGQNGRDGQYVHSVRTFGSEKEAQEWEKSMQPQLSNSRIFEGLNSLSNNIWKESFVADDFEKYDAYEAEQDRKTEQADRNKSPRPTLADNLKKMRQGVYDNMTPEEMKAIQDYKAVGGEPTADQAKALVKFQQLSENLRREMMWLTLRQACEKTGIDQETLKKCMDGNLDVLTEQQKADIERALTDMNLACTKDFRDSYKNIIDQGLREAERQNYAILNQGREGVAEDERITPTEENAEQQPAEPEVPKADSKGTEEVVSPVPAEPTPGTEGESVPPTPEGEPRTEDKVWNAVEQRRAEAQSQAVERARERYGDVIDTDKDGREYVFMARDKYHDEAVPVRLDPETGDFNIAEAYGGGVMHPEDIDMKTLVKLPAEEVVRKQMELDGWNEERVREEEEFKNRYPDLELPHEGQVVKSAYNGEMYIVVGEHDGKFVIKSADYKDGQYVPIGNKPIEMSMNELGHWQKGSSAEGEKPVGKGNEGKLPEDEGGASANKSETGGREYSYRLTQRPFGIGTQPEGQLRHVDDGKESKPDNDVDFSKKDGSVPMTGTESVVAAKPQRQVREDGAKWAPTEDVEMERDENGNVDFEASGVVSTVKHLYDPREMSESSADEWVESMLEKTAGETERYTADKEPRAKDFDSVEEYKRAKAEWEAGRKKANDSFDFWRNVKKTVEASRKRYDLQKRGLMATIETNAKVDNLKEGESAVIVQDKDGIVSVWEGNPEVGTVTGAEYLNNQDAERVKELENLAKRSKIRIVIHNGDVRYSADGGKVKITAFNGFQEGNTIHISSSAQHPVEFVLGHEFTHQMGKKSRSSLQEFIDTVKEAMGKDEWQNEVQKRRDMGYSPKKIGEEIAADYAGRMLEDREFAKRFFDKFDPTDDQGKENKLKSLGMMTKLLNKLKLTKEQSKENPEQAREQNKVQKAFEKMLDDYSQKILNEVEAKPKDDGKGAIPDSIGQKGADGSVTMDETNFSLKTYQPYTDNLGFEHKGTRQSTIDYMKENGYSDKEIKDLTDRMDYIYEYFGNLSKFTDADGKLKFEAFNEWNKTQPTYKRVGLHVEKALSSLVSNGEYPINIELSTDCIKREAFTQLLNGITDFNNGKALANLTPENIVVLEKMMDSYGVQTACRMCFVEGKRLGILNWSDTIANDWNCALNEALGLGVEWETYKEGNSVKRRIDADKVRKALAKRIGSDDVNFGFGQGDYVSEMSIDEMPQETNENRAEKALMVKRINNVFKTMTTRKESIEGDKIAKAVDRLARRAERLMEELENKWRQENPGKEEYIPTRKDLDAISALLDKNKKAVFDKMVRAIIRYPELAKVMDKTDLIGSKGLDDMRNRGGAFDVLFSLCQARFGSGTPKIVQRAEPYAGEIVEEGSITDNMVEKANRMGAARLFSFSDFDITKIFDICQIISDAEARGLKLQSYSKEVPYILFFGNKTGVKINMSTLTEVVVSEELKSKYDNTRGKENKEAVKKEIQKYGGLVLDKDGNITGVTWSDSHSINPKFAEAIFHNDAYNANCGATTVGVGINHCIYTMGLPWIRQVIPFHLSGMPIASRRRSDVGWYKDFTSSQNTRIKNSKGEYVSINGTNGKKLATKRKLEDYDFYKDEDKEGFDFRQTVRDYIKWCRKNDLLPRFDWAVNADAYAEACRREGYEPNKQLYDMMKADETDGVWNQYYKTIADKVVYKPVFDKEGNLVGETASRHNKIKADFSMDKKTTDMLFEGEGSMLEQRENSIRHNNEMMDEMSYKAVRFLNGQIGEEELMSSHPEKFDKDYNAHKYFDSEGVDYSVKSLSPQGLALRNGLIDHMQKYGMDFITDIEGAQRVLDEANGKVRLSAKRRALETASLSREEKDQPTVVSSADGAKVLKSLDEAKEKYDNNSNRSKTFLGDLAKAIGAERHGSLSQYASFEAVNGSIVTIRLSNHNAKVSNFDNRDEAEGISIVVSPKKSEGITNDGDAHVMEYYYDALKLRRSDGSPLASIVESLKQSLYSGEFKDKTGLAEVQEVNGNDIETTRPKFFRTADGEAYGFTVGGKIYVDPRIADSETPIHEYGHLWATAVRASDPEKWGNIVDVMKASTAWDEAKKLYPELKSDDDIADEAVNMYSGRRGAERLRQMQEEIAKGDGTATEKAKAIGAINRLKQVLSDFWKGVAKTFGFSKEYRNADEIADAIMSDLLEGVDPRKVATDDRLREQFVGDDHDVDFSKKSMNAQGRVVEQRHREYEDLQKEWKDLYGEMSEKYGTNLWFMKRYNPDLSDEDARKRKDINQRLREAESSLREAEKDYDLAVQQQRQGDAKAEHDRLNKIFDSAKEEYGVTDDFDNAGYILPSGEMLDFSEGGYGRTIDHRNIGDITGEGESENRYDYVNRFKNAGAIRIVPESNGLDMNGMPSKEQMKTIKDFARHTGGEMTIDFTDADGNVEHSVSYGEATPQRIEADIRRYYDEGMRPVGDMLLSRGDNEGSTSFSKIEDPELLRRLNDEIERGEFVTAYRAINTKDGEWYSPMAGGGLQKGAKKNGYVGMYQPKEGEFEQADEHPELIQGYAKEGHGMITILKDDGKGATKVAYNPYLHASRQMLNDQFTSAWKRPGLVTMAVMIPKSELSSGYRAEGAKNSVGETSWHSGPLSSRLPEGQERKVILSRYDKPMGIVGMKEWGDSVQKQLNDAGINDVPWNCFTPEQRDELVNRGFEVTKPKGDIGADGMAIYEHWNRAYEEWRNGEGSKPFVSPKFDYRELPTVKNGKKSDLPEELFYHYGEKATEENGEVDFSKKVFGGNSGYVGYSISKRGARAKEEGRFPKGEFRKEYDVTAKAFDALVDLGVIDDSEWHHTSMYGNRTTFYGWDEDALDIYQANKKEIDSLARDVAKAREFEKKNKFRKIFYFDMRSGDVNDIIENDYKLKALDEGTYEELRNVENLRETEGYKKFYEEEMSLRAEMDELKKKAAEAKKRIEEIFDEDDDEPQFSKKTGKEAEDELRSIFAKPVTEELPKEIPSLEEFTKVFDKPVKSIIGEHVAVGEGVYNKILRNSRQMLTGAILPTLQHSDFVLKDNDSSNIYVKRFKKPDGESVYNVAIVNKKGELEDYVSSVHIKSDNNLLNKIKNGAELILPTERTTYGQSPTNSTPSAKVENISETTKSEGVDFSLKSPGVERKYQNGVPLKLEGETIPDYVGVLSRSLSRNMANDAAKETLAKELQKAADKYTTNALRSSELRRLAGDIRVAKKGNLPGLLLEVDQIVGGARVRQALGDLRKTLKTAMTKQNNQGMTVAKGVDEYTRIMFETVNKATDGLLKSGIEAEMGDIRRDIWYTNKDLKEAKAALEGAESAEDIAEWQGKVKELEQRKSELKQQLADKKVESKKVIAEKLAMRDDIIDDELRKLDEKYSSAMDGDGVWTESDMARYTGLTLMKPLANEYERSRHVEDLYEQIDELEKERHELQSQAVEAKKAGNEEDAKSLRKQANGIKANVEQKMRELNDAQSVLYENVTKQNELLNAYIKNGHENLKNKIREEMERRRRNVAEFINSIDYQGEITPTSSKRDQVSGWRKLTSGNAMSLEYLMRILGADRVGTDNALYQHYIYGKDGIQAAESAYNKAIQNFRDLMDAKCKEIFGQSAKKVFGAAENEENVLHLVLTPPNGKKGNLGWTTRDEKLTIAQAMYVYQVNKMADGKTKLEGMGINDKVMETIENWLPKEYKDMADWMQEEYYPALRERYNERYLEMYNTSLDNIENYCPLKIDGAARGDKDDMSRNTESTESLNVKAGSLVARTTNSLPIDLRWGAFRVLQDHVEKMEDFYNFARVRKDLTGLIQSPYIRNMLNSKRAGLFNDFRTACHLATRTYQPEMENGTKWMDIAQKGLTGGALNFRAYTALKQLLSYPAFLEYCDNPKDVAKWVAQIFRRGNYDWAMEHLPAFRERVYSGDLGDTRIIYGGDDVWNKRLDWVNNKGLWMNRRIDALTCAAGAKMVYDKAYKETVAKYERIFRKQGLDVSAMKDAINKIADREASLQAEVAFNTSQQSSVGAYVSENQKSRTMLMRALTLFQNSNISYWRKVGEGFNEARLIMKDKKKYIDSYTEKYQEEGWDDKTAEKLARKQVKHILIKAVAQMANFGLLLQWLWDKGGSAVESLYDLIGSDEDTKSADADWSTYVNYAQMPFRGVMPSHVIEGLLSGMANNTDYNPVMVFSEYGTLLKQIEKDWDTGGAVPAMMSLALNLIGNASGIKLTTITDVTQGFGELYDAVREGNANKAALGIALLASMPASQRKVMAQNMLADLPAEEYAHAVGDVVKRIPVRSRGDYMRLCMGYKVMSDQERKELELSQFDRSKVNAVKEQDEREETLKKYKKDLKGNPFFSRKERENWLAEHPEDKEEFDEMDKSNWGSKKSSTLGEGYKQTMRTQDDARADNEVANLLAERKGELSGKGDFVDALKAYRKAIRQVNGAVSSKEATAEWRRESLKWYREKRAELLKLLKQ